MNKKLIGKTLDNAAASKVVSDFHAEDYAVRDKSEILVSAAQLRDYKSRLSAELDNILRESGATELSDKIKDVESKIKDLDSILLTREFDDDDKILVSLTKDDVVEVNDGNESRYETAEIVNVQEYTYYEVKYRIVKLDEYISTQTRTNLTENDLCYDLVHKLMDLNLHCVISIGKMYFNELPASDVAEIVESTYRWHLIARLLSVNSVKLNSNLKIYPDARDELIASGFIIKYADKKTKVPSSVQLNLFGDVDEEEVNIVLEGDDLNE